MNTSLAAVADSILNSVNSPRVEKTASVTHASGVGAGLSKIAADLRSHNPSAVTYADLLEFRSRYGV